MAVAVDTVGAGGAGNTNQLTWLHTASGSNRHVLIGVGFTSGTVDSVTYGAITCSLVTGTNVGTGDQNVEIWEPDSEPGTAEVTVTVNLSGMNQCQGNSVSFTGVDTTGPTANGTGSTDTVVTAHTETVTSATGDFVLDMIRATETLVVDGSQAQQWNTTQGGQSGASSTEAGGSSIAMDWTFASSDVAHAGVSVVAAAGAPAVDWGFLPSDNQPLFVHPRRQAAGVVLQEIIATRIPVPVAVLTLTGQAPVVDTGLIVPVATLTLTGFAPIVETGIGIPVAVLTLTGFAPDVLTPEPPAPDANIEFIAITDEHIQVPGRARNM